MAFPKLSQRELFGLFDPNYDKYSVLADIFLNSEIGAEIFTDINKILTAVQIAGEALHPDFDMNTMAVNYSEGGTTKLYEAYKKVSMFTSTYGKSSYAYGIPRFSSLEEHEKKFLIKDADPENFINDFVVPKVEELVDVDANEIEKLVTDLQNQTIPIQYYFQTTRKHDQGRGTSFKVDLSTRERVQRQNAGELVRERRSGITSRLEKLIGKSATQLVVLSTLRRNHWNTSKEEYVFSEDIHYLSIDASNVTGNTLPFYKFEKEYEATGQGLAPNTSVGTNHWMAIFQPGDISGVSGTDLDNFMKKVKAADLKDHPNMLKPKELTRMIMVRLALRVLAVYSNEVLYQLSKLDDDEDKQLLANTEEILSAAKREVAENPDGSGMSEQERENMSSAIQRGFQIRPQCILTKNILELAKLNRKRLNAAFSQTTKDYEIDYKYTRMVSNPSNTAATINKLSKRESQKDLLTLRPHQLARLVPYLRLYKVITDQQDRTNEVEFKFPNFTNVQKTNPKMDLFTPISNNLTQEYGVKSFNWKFIGSDPFSYSNDIEASLSLFFNDFEQLMAEREGTLVNQKGKKDPEKMKYRLLDLISISEIEQAALKKIGSRFDIRVDVGWSGPSNPQEIGGYNTESSIRTMFLVMTDYDISFNQEGHFELIINYKSRLEQAMYDKKTNILVPSPSVESKISSIEEELEAARASGGQNVELTREKEQKLEELRLGSKQEAYQNIFNFLLQNSSVYSQNLTAAQLFGSDAVSVASATPSSSGAGVFDQLSSRIEKIKEAKRNEESEDTTKKDEAYFPVKKSGNDYVLNYFFLGDLVESLAQKCFEPAGRSTQEQKFLDDTRIVLTDFIIYDPKDLKNKNVLKINIGDIPISVELFMSFYYEKVVKYNVGSYSLMKFVRDIISYCIINIFEECFGEDNLRTDIKTGFMDFRKESGKDPFESYALSSNKGKPLKLGESDLGEKYKFDAKSGLWSSISKAYLDIGTGLIPKIASRDERANCIHACIISSESFEKSQLLIDPDYESKRGTDIESGLYHLDIGSGRGILKKINFSKTDQKFLREQRFTQDEAKGFSILSNVFDVDVTLVGNTLFFPGQRVFIKLGERFSALDEKLPVAPGNKTKRLGETFATTMGLGGYHLVISVENEISPSGFETKLNARYEWHGREIKDANPLQDARNVSAHALHSTPSPD